MSNGKFVVLLMVVLGLLISAEKGPAHAEDVITVLLRPAPAACCERGDIQRGRRGHGKIKKIVGVGCEVIEATAEAMNECTSGPDAGNGMIAFPCPPTEHFVCFNDPTDREKIICICED